MKSENKKWYYTRKGYGIVLLVIHILAALIFVIVTYSPQYIVKINPSEVLYIDIAVNNSDVNKEVRDRKDIEYIVNNLGQIKFKRGKQEFGNLGHSFKLSLYKNDGKLYKVLTIISDNTIFMGGFLYTDKLNNIDYDYYENLVYSE